MANKCFEFESDRLGFRSWQDADRTIFACMNIDSRVMEFFPKTLNAVESNALVERFEHQLEQKLYGLWALELKSTGQFIGFLGFNDTNFSSDFTPCVEIGWRLHPEYWGRGLASEGGRKCLDFGFSRFDFDRVYSFTAVENIRSQRVMAAIGMKKIRHFMHPNIPADNHLAEHVLYGIDRPSF